MTRRIDAHQHFWNLDRINYPILSEEAFGELYRTIEPHELKPIIDRVDVDATIVVQAKDDIDETQYLLELAEQHDWIAGVVGWVDLAHPAKASEQLREFVDYPKFKGVRHLIMVETDADWLIRPSVREGLKILADADVPFEVGAEFPNHLCHVPTVAERIPELRLVIDHLAKPPVDGEEMIVWKEEMKRAASFPNVYVKVSALDPTTDVKSIVDFAFNTFGADRLMYGSDWPLAHFRGGYDVVWRSLNEAVKNRPQNERDALFGGTAEQFYRL